MRSRVLGASLAMLVSYPAILSIGYGLVGSAGNSAVSGLVLIGLLVIVFALSARDQIHLNYADLLFASMVSAAAISTLINGSGDQREFVLMTLTFAAYAACRFMTAETVYFLLPAFKRACAVVVAIGAACTAIELLTRDPDSLSKPAVLGFESLPTQILTMTGFLILGLAASNDHTARRTAIISALAFLPVAIFAAAMVRFTFAALVASLTLSLMLAWPGNRRYVAVIILTVLLAVGAGLSLRSNVAATYTGYLLSVITQGGDAPPGEGCKHVNLRNSIDIRRHLAIEALQQSRGAGLFGHGLDSFKRQSCLKQTPHNSVLQAVVEFGWLAGAVFVALIGLSLLALLPAALHDSSVRFVLCGLVFILLIGMAHGRLSRDIALFAFIGCAVGISSGLRMKKLTGIERALSQGE